MHTLSRAVAALLLLLAARGLVPRAAAAQADPSPTWGFVTARYSTATSGFVFGGYGHGAAFAMIGMVNNPHSGYTEFLAGGGARFATGARVSHAVALAASHATESWYAQLYWLPTVTLGAVTAEATVQAYAPLEAAGDAQLAVNPLSVLVPLGRRLSAGVTYQLALQDGIGPGHAAGVALRVAVPAGAVTLDLLHGLRSFDDEMRLSFRAFY